MELEFSLRNNKKILIESDSTAFSAESITCFLYFWLVGAQGDWIALSLDLLDKHLLHSSGTSHVACSLVFLVFS